jgi:hypothetical protein
MPVLPTARDPSRQTRVKIGKQISSDFWQKKREFALSINPCYGWAYVGIRARRAIFLENGKKKACIFAKFLYANAS